MAARTSATWSTSVVSVSCPTAVTTGVRQAAIARTSPSSENGSRSSTEPPPRAITMTSTAGSASSRRSPSMTAAAAVRPLHGAVVHREPHGRPAPPGGDQHVALGGAVAAGDDTDDRGREGQRPLADGVEQALRGEQPADPLDAGQQLAEADGADLGGAQRERAAGDVVVGPGPDDDPRALGQLEPGPVGDVAMAGDRHRQVGGRVAQGEEHRGRVAAPGQLRDLTLDPHLAEPADPVGDLARHRAHRPRRLGRRRCGHAPAGERVMPRSLTTRPADGSRSGRRAGPSGLAAIACSSSFSSRLRSIRR